ncbi:hypothetical protein L208DRAFT_1426555 [Tricholoma matsutake]|nr:hypothetical protein L208DRAFT_1426555 [Tricholoma matsutake 945]
MNDVPYTTPEEDPFNVQPLLLQPRRRRSSMLNKWIQEQQTQPHTIETPTDGHLPLQPPNASCVDTTSDCNLVLDDALTLNSYDLVEDDDIPLNTTHESEVPSTPMLARSPRTSKILRTPSPFRAFNLSFCSTSPALSQSSESSCSRPRISFFPRTPQHGAGAGSARSTAQQHNKSSSLSAVNLTGKSPFRRDLFDTGISHKWRPSVLGHFHGSSTPQTSVVPSDMVYTPSRPSVSSGDSTTITTDCDLPLTPSRVRFMDSIRSLNRSSGKGFSIGSGIASSSSILSEDRSVDSDQLSRRARSLPVRLPLSPKQKSCLASSNYDEKEDADCHDIPPNSIRQPNSTRARVVYSSSGTLPRVNFAPLSSRQKKKRKLVVSGVGHKDFRKFEGVKRWCESFGEVSQIIRMPNGDLHVHFRLAEVADTVCRLRARVYIAGVGSVQLSWSTVDKR